jgi:hypothetical protein
MGRWLRRSDGPVPNELTFAAEVPSRSNDRYLDDGSFPTQRGACVIVLMPPIDEGTPSQPVVVSVG